MSDASHRERAERIRHLLATEGDAVEANTRAFNRGRYDAVADLEDYEETKARARAIKEDAIADLPALLDDLTAAVEANGGHVYLADDAADATAYVREVVADADADTVVKSKSMTSEELGVNDALTDDGVDVWETDLGEFVLQVADEAPSHIVAPAIHRSRDDIADLFAEQFDPDEPLESAAELTAFARDFLADRIAEADVGLTGANFLVAESGTLALVTSEGNARKTVAGTDTHVAVAGVEKVIPTLADLQPFVELIARSGTGQDITSYVSLFTPPGDTPPVDREDDTPLRDRDADRDFHLVLVDNGRLDVREDPALRETLYCIRCSACLNSCANFQQVGGHAFGGETYSGGIGTGWEATVGGEEAAADFVDLCTGCTRCVNQCPVNIDVPWLNTVVRDRLNRGADPGRLDWVYEGLTPDAEPGGLDPAKRLFGNVDTLARVASATAPASNWLARRGPVRALLERAAGVDRDRPLPEFRRETLVDWFADRGPRVAAADARREAVLYPDVYTNHAGVARGKAAVRVLEALGVRVRVPALPESGRAPLSQGMVTTATERSEAFADAVEPHLDAGRDLVVVEPSDLAMVRREHEKLLDGDRADRLAGGTFDLFEYVHGLLANGADGDALGGHGESLAYHPHCQARTLGVHRYTTAVLEERGHDVATTEAECCGMAGSFGYKAAFADLSEAVGESLREELDAGETADRTVVASGTSCLEQLEGLLERRPRHPVEVVDPGRRNRHR